MNNLDNHDHINTLFERSFDLNSNIIYFPVRHHSPACSYHIKKIIDEYSPDCVLIEGPSDADDLIEILKDTEQVRPPICIYSSFDDKNGAVSEECEKYRAYYPFLEYSPELIAIRYSAQNNIDSHFIDLSYQGQILNVPEQKKTYEFYNDNSSDYYRLVAEKSGCRSFGEFWERYFETAAFEKSSADFVKSVFMLGAYMRKLSNPDMLNSYREFFMKNKIKEYQKKYNKIMVIAGAFHICGLTEDSKAEKLKLKKPPASQCGNYIMPYSFAETDSRSGYGAGIPFPAFYSKVWETLNNNEQKPYDKCVADFIITASRHARKKQPVSLPDETQALYMAKELAALRDKSQAGAYELLDGAAAAFVKGDINSSAAFEIDFLMKIMTGMGAGTIKLNDENAELIPPCAVDFLAKCKTFRINTGNVAIQNITLDVVKNPKHYAKSCFLHQMDFLGTGFCKCEKGPDYVNNRNTSLVREIWTARFSSDVMAKLIDLSVYGSSVEELCINLLKKDFANCITAETVGKFLLKIYVLGLSDKLGFYLDDSMKIILSDNDFISECSLISSLNKLIVLQKQITADENKKAAELLKTAFEIAMYRLNDVKSADNIAEEICEGIKIMYSISSDYEYCPRETFLNEISAAANSDSAPEVFGACIALSFKSGKISQTECCDSIENYMLSANFEDAARFLVGLIYLGRDIIFTNIDVLLSIDNAVSQMTPEEFMEILPVMRRGFTEFLPTETSRISKTITSHYNADENAVSGSLIFSSEEIVFAKQCDKDAFDLINEWGLLDHGADN